MPDIGHAGAGSSSRKTPASRDGSNEPVDSLLHNSDPRGSLKVDTQIRPDELTSVSMLPTPLLPQGSFDTNEGRPVGRGNSKRIFSSSLVPDAASSLSGGGSFMSPISPHQNLASPQSAHEHANRPSLSLARADSLVVPKRGERLVNLSRSGSVGSPQRQPTTILHREPEITPSPEIFPEEVYLAEGIKGEKTAWSRVRFSGKGSFSEVVLAKPASQFLRPEHANEIIEEANRELAMLDEPGSEVSKPEETRALVAVKITTLTDGKSEAQLKFFKRDVDLMSTIPHHPSLMRMVGSSLDQTVHNRALFILPYCPGGDLFDLVSQYRSKLSSLLIRRLFADTCSAVAFLHDNLVAHRDIKLENVLLNVRAPTLINIERPDLYGAPLAVLTDFGLARRIDAENPLLTTRCGSDDYVPPEIMLGQQYDGRETDSWALGVLLYAMLEGRLPFDPPPNALMDGKRARLRTAHRIARVDWTWYKRRDAEGTEWQGGKEVVEGCLERRSHRRLAKDSLKLPWVADALPAHISDSRDVDSLWQMFVQ